MFRLLIFPCLMAIDLEELLSNEVMKASCTATCNQIKELTEMTTCQEVCQVVKEQRKEIKLCSLSLCTYGCKVACRAGLTTQRVSDEVQLKEFRQV